MLAVSVTERDMDYRIKLQLRKYPNIPPATIHKVILFAEEKRNSGYIDIFLRLLEHLRD